MTFTHGLPQVRIVKIVCLTSRGCESNSFQNISEIFEKEVMPLPDLHCQKNTQILERTLSKISLVAIFTATATSSS